MALPAAVQCGLAFLLMDLTFYYWHLANHKLAVLWRFHTVHHLDPDLDVSTALRFHPGEVLLSAGFRVLQVSLLGVSPLTCMLYEGVFQASTLFHHSNVRLPLRAERLLNLVLVTPRMHGIHHSVVAEETNANYATVFSWWDRLHRSMRLDVPQATLVIGVPAYHEPRDNAWWPVLTLPFRPQRARTGAGSMGPDRPETPPRRVRTDPDSGVSPRRRGARSRLVCKRMMGSAGLSRKIERHFVRQAISPLLGAFFETLVPRSSGYYK